MHVQWALYRFDHARFLALRPQLRAAATSADLARLACTAETCAVAEAFEEGEITVGEARSMIVQALCFDGAPLPVDAGLLRLVAALQRIAALEDSGELLNAMLSGGHHIEPWLRPAAGLVGFLTPEEVYQIHTTWLAAEPRALKRAQSAGAPRRRGGLLRPLIQLLQHLRASGPPPGDLFRLLNELLADAVGSNEGIAALSIDS